MLLRVVLEQQCWLTLVERHPHSSLLKLERRSGQQTDRLRQPFLSHSKKGVVGSLQDKKQYPVSNRSVPVSSRYGFCL